MNFAVLLTAHNRKIKTLACLKSLYNAILPKDYIFDVYLVDDGSIDGTILEVKKHFPKVNIIEGNGQLFWAGGMRLAWNKALQNEKYDAFLLLNDDVILSNEVINNLKNAQDFSLEKFKQEGIYCGTTINNENNKTSYGGILLTKNSFIVRSKRLDACNQCQNCHMANANILWVSKETVEKIGIFSNKYTHGIADYDYTYTAFKNKIPLIVAPGVCGECTDDHGNNWKSKNVKLKQRIAFLKSPKGLAYNEYLYYIWKNFPLFYPYSFIMLWLKVFFPFLWDNLKK